jgi:hypothetical protein
MFKLIFALIIVIFSLENDALPTFGGDRLETIYPDFQNITGLWAGIITSELELSDLAVYRRSCDIVVVKRNESGSYDDFASYQMADYDCHLKFLITYTSLAFNGEWIAVVSSPVSNRNATSLLFILYMRLALFMVWCFWLLRTPLS